MIFWSSLWWWRVIVVVGGATNSKVLVQPLTCALANTCSYTATGYHRHSHYKKVTFHHHHNWSSKSFTGEKISPFPITIFQHILIVPVQYGKRKLANIEKNDNSALVIIALLSTVSLHHPSVRTVPLNIWEGGRCFSPTSWPQDININVQHSFPSQKCLFGILNLVSLWGGFSTLL